MEGLDEDLLHEPSENYEQVEYVREELSTQPEEDPEEEPFEEDPEEESFEEDPEEESFEEDPEEEEETAEITEKASESPSPDAISESEVHNSIPLCSPRRVRFDELDPLHVYQRHEKRRQDGSSEPEFEFNGPCAFKQQGCTGSSQKRQCTSRWDTGAKAIRADSERETDQMTSSSALPDLNPETLRLKTDLLDIVNKLLKPEIHDQRPEEERSPSPEPLYLGIRINTQEVRLRQKLVDQRHYIISKLIEKDPTFKPPHDYKPPKYFKKIYIPVKKYPDFNFIGLLLGPQGSTQKKMEMETGAKILLRGKGSSRTPQNNPSENEELHVYIRADDRKSLDAAVSMVEEILNLSDGSVKPRRAQLEEFAKLKTRNEPKHQHYPLSCLLPSSELAFSGGTCSSNSMPTQNSEVGLPASQAMNKEIFDNNLFVACLPISTNENNLKDLFSVFGKISSVKAVRDPVTGICKGYGFVSFENARDASAAVTHMNGYELNGHILVVREAGQPQVLKSHEESTSVKLGTTVTQSKSSNEIDLANVYVCYLPRSMDENHLVQLFSPFGEITSAKLVKDWSTGKSKGFGFVHFKNASDAAVAVAYMNGRQVDGHLLGVRVAGRTTGLAMPSSHGHSKPATSVGEGKFSGETDAAKLIVFYLPQAVDEYGLLELFSRFGKITLAKVARDHVTGISKGTGFVHFESAEDAKRAMVQVNGLVMEGHMLKVEAACPKPVAGFSVSTSPISQLQGTFGDPNLLVRCIPEDVDENYLAMLFSPYGKIDHGPDHRTQERMWRYWV